MVQAIHPEGQINVNECLYCLHCQVVYKDHHDCPVLIQKDLKLKRREARIAAVKGEDAPDASEDSEETNRKL